VRDTPLSIASAVHEMLINKERKTELTIDICSVLPGDRATQITNSLLRVAQLLNLRAGRLLSATDIADMMEWLAPMSETKLDGATVYGSTEWGPFLRRSAAHGLFKVQFAGLGLGDESFKAARRSCRSRRRVRGVRRPFLRSNLAARLAAGLAALRGDFGRDLGRAQRLRNRPEQRPVWMCHLCVDSCVV
jgi:hypothetical protein